MERKSKNPILNVAPGAANPVPPSHNVQTDFPMIIVMIAVLAIILIFCFWGAPGVRAYCKRKICHRCPRQDARESSGTPADDRSATPTIILLPYGRMLVVDRNVINQLQADQTGIDFMELSANLIRAHHLRCSSTPSILDSETTSKGLSPISLGFSPPSYEDIFGEKSNDLPPSYSELSLLFRQRQMDSSEMQCFNLGSMTARSNAAVRETVLNMNVNEVSDVTTRIEVAESDEECKENEEITISVPSNSRENELPIITNSVSSVNDDLSYPNCKYCIMSLESGRRAKIKCYCYEESTNANKCVLVTRSVDGNQPCSSITANQNENSECSAEENMIGRETCKITIKDESDSMMDKDKDDNECTLNQFTNSGEEACSQSCDDIRESSL